MNKRLLGLGFKEVKNFHPSALPCQTPNI